MPDQCYDLRLRTVEMEDPEFVPAPAWLVAAMGTSFLIIILLLVYSLAVVWPTPVTVAGTPASPSVSQTNPPSVPVLAPHLWEPTVDWFTLHRPISDELRLLLIVIIAAGLGSYIHAATSFASYVGNRRMQASWVWWYILRGPIGIALALTFYTVFRGGLLSSGAVGTDVSPFGVAALASMVGLFSKQATDKLRETADNLFRTVPGEGDDARGGKLKPQNPVIDSITPPDVPQGAANVALHLKGKNFSKGAVVQVNGAERPTDFVSDTALVAHLDPADTAAAGTLTVTVKGPPPANRQSDSATFKVRQAPGLTL